MSARAADAASELAVGDPARTAIGRAVLATLALAVGFGAYTWAAKDVPALYVHTPWQDDPYDVLVSFAFVGLPLLTALCLVRVALCRRLVPLPVRRAVDVVAACRLLLAAVAVTVASEWLSVVLDTRRDAWNVATLVLLALLSLATIAVVVVARLLRKTGLGRRDAPPQPDWLADALALGRRQTGCLGPLRSHATDGLGWLDAQIATRIRAHPLWAAGVSAVGVGAAGDSVQIVQEGYRPTMALFFVTVSASSLFAFLVVAGAYLRLVERRAAPSSAAIALVAACTAVPVAVAFRGSLWWVIGTREEAAGLGELTLLVVIMAAVAGAVTEAVVTGHRALRERIVL